MIDLTKNDAQLKRNIQRCKERRIIIPTFGQLKDPKTVPEKVKSRLKTIGLWDIAPENLFRITWKNEPVEKGGLFTTSPNFLEIPT